MDTKSKKYDAKTSLLVAGIFESIAISVAVIAGSIFVAISSMKYLDGDSYGYYHGGHIANSLKFQHFESGSGILMIVSCLIALIFLVVIIALVCKDQNSIQNPRWYERTWTEFKLIVFAGGASLVVASAAVFWELWFNGSYLGIWTPSGDGGAFNTSSSVILLFAICILAIGCAISVFEFTTIVKYIRNKQFIKKSLIGGIVIYIYKLFRNSNRTMLKVLIFLIGGTFLSGIWIGLPFVLALILVAVPKKVRKYEAIKTGVSEIREGNLSYKIDVEKDGDSYKTELDELADSINDISNAANIAVQNELKNQKLKTELISNVSHDIKTPLTSMISYVHLLKSEGLDSENAEEYLNIIDEKTKRLKTLTENLFEAAKASSGDIPVNMELINLSALLTQSLAEVDELFQGKNLDVKVKNNSDEVYVYADGQLMHRVLDNLLGNISKYALEGSRVYIDLNEVESYGNPDNKLIKLDIKNISKDPLNIPADELMERFKRGDESRNTEGSGLGLAIANDLMKLMNGRLELSIDGDLFKASILMKAEKTSKN